MTDNLLAQLDQAEAAVAQIEAKSVPETPLVETIEEAPAATETVLELPPDAVATQQAEEIIKEPLVEKPAPESATVRHAGLVAQLKEHCQNVHAWPAELARQLDVLRTGEIFAIFRKLNLRGRLYTTPDGKTSVEDSEVPTWHTRVASSQRSDLSRWARAQALHFLSRFPRPVKQRLMHIFQVHLMPDFLVRKAYSYYGLTFLPTDRNATLREIDEPNGAKSIERFVPLHKARAAVVSVRDHTFDNGHTGSMWDYKLLRFEVEPDTHRILLGGNYNEPSGQVRSRCSDAWQFNYAPHPRATEVVLDTELRDIVSTGLDLHWAIEQACLKTRGRQPEMPEFPQVWLQFDGKDTVDAEVEAPGLQEKAWREVALWFQARRPTKWGRLHCLCKKPAEGPTIAHQLTRAGNSWDDIVEQLGEPEPGSSAELLLLQTIQRCQIDNYRSSGYMMPLDFFVPGSPQKPIYKASNVFLDFSGLCGRASSDPREENPDLDYRQARLQVVYIPGRDRLEGHWDDITYDFTAVPPKYSHKFIDASR